MNENKKIALYKCMTMKAIEEVAEPAVKLQRENGEPVNIERALMKTAIMEVRLANDAITESTTEAERAYLSLPVKGVIKAFNDYHRHLAVYRYASMKSDDAWREYLVNQSIRGASLKWSDDTEEFYLDVKDDGGYSHPYDVMRYVCGAAWPKVADAIRIFADNCVRFSMQNDGMSVNKKPIDSSYVEVRNRMGWDKFDTLSALSRQLTDLFGWMMPGVGIKAINADVKYVISSVYKPKSEKNKAGSYVMRDINTMADFIFRAAYTRYNKLAYEFQGEKKGDVALTATKHNKEMGEKAAPKKKDAETVGETKVGKAPAKKKPAKAKKEEPVEAVETIEKVEPAKAEESEESK